MAVTKLSSGSSFTNLRKYDSFLAGNPSYVPPSFESIATATGTGSSNTITFSGIPSTYKHLQIRFRVKDTENLGVRNTNILGLYFNGSTTAGTYGKHRIYGDGTSALPDGSSTSQMSFSQTIICSLPAEDEMFTVGIVDIIDYASTTKNKTAKMIIGTDANFASTQYKIQLASGVWVNTNAVTSITLNISGGGNFTNTSSVALYGIKGA